VKWFVRGGFEILLTQTSLRKADGFKINKKKRFTLISHFYK